MKYNAPLFTLGQTVATPGAVKAFKEAGETPAAFLRRHQACDWGEICEADKRANDAAVAHEGDPERRARVLSAYILADKTKIWVITGADRSSTCLLLPEEY